MMRLLLLTATVAPAGQTQMLTLRDPELRLKQYASAISQWLGEDLVDRCVVIENSGQAASLRRDLPDDGRLEVREGSFGPDVGARGKGAQEAAVLAQFVPADEPVLGPADWIWKCTGRLTVHNFARLVANEGTGDLSVRYHPDLTACDARLYGVRAGLWQSLFADLHRDVDEEAGRYIEHALWRRVLQVLGAGAAFAPMLPSPDFRGESGSTGQRYGSLTGRAQRLAGDQLRQIVYRRSLRL